MECRFCRNEIGEGERFCPYCGGEQYSGYQGSVPEDESTQILGQDFGSGQTYAQEAGGTQLLTPDMEYYRYDQGNQYENQNAQAQSVSGAKEQQADEAGKQAVQGEQPVGDNGQEDNGKGKGKKKKKWLFIAIPIVIAAAVAVFMLLFAFKANDSEIFYLKDNELLGADLAESKPEGYLYTEKYYADRDDFQGYMNGVISKSEDGRYLFFSANYEDGIYTLYCKDLKKEKEEAFKIDSDVTSYTITDNNKVVYRKDNDALYVHNLKNKEKIAGDVYSYRVAVDGSYVMWTVESEDYTYDMYYRDLALKKNKEKVDSYVNAQIISSANLDHIVYTKDNNLYVVDNWGDKVKLASDVDSRLYSATYNGERIVYFLKEGEALTAGDLIKDDMKSEAGNTFIEQFNERIAVEVDIYTLGCYNMEKGTSNELDTDVVGVESFGTGAVMYGKLLRDEIKKVNLSEVYRGSTSTITENIESAGEIYVAAGSSTAQMDVESFNIGTSIYDQDNECIYFMLFPEDDYEMGELMCFDCSVKGFGDITTVEVDVNKLLEVHQGKVYYLCDYSSDSGELYCDGDNIASDVCYSEGIEGSDSVLIFSDISRDGNSCSVSLYKNGKLTGIADDVASYVVLSEKKIAMLVDYNFEKYRGDLVYYNGKKTMTVDTDVSAIYD